MAKVIDFKAVLEAKRQREVEQKKREFDLAEAEVKAALQRSAKAYGTLVRMGVQVG